MKSIFYHNNHLINTLTLILPSIAIIENFYSISTVFEFSITLIKFI